MPLVPCPAWLIRKDQSKPCISFDGKVDGFGAELVQMVFAMSYTADCGALFCGVGWWATELTHGVHVPTAIQRLFGECALPVLRPLSGQPPCNSTGRPDRCHFSGLPQLLFHLTYMTPAFLTDLCSILLPQLLPLAKAHDGRFSVAMHIRRGDIIRGRHCVTHLTLFTSKLQQLYLRFGQMLKFTFLATARNLVCSPDTWTLAFKFTSAVMHLRPWLILVL